MTVAFVAVNHKHKIVGHINAYREPETQRWNLGMMVHKAYRGRGVGTGLMQHLIAWARANGIGALYLEVFAHNEAALTLYRRFLFVQSAYNKAHLLRRNGERWDTVEMVLKLA